LKNDTIELERQDNTPLIVLADIKDKENIIKEVLATTTPKLTYNNKKWEISKHDLSQILEFQHNKEKNIITGINQELFSKWLDENISSTINIEPKMLVLKLVVIE